MPRYDAIVIGLGGMGSAALQYLSARGQKVVGFDQFDVPNDRGSSHGETRIIRRAYFEHPDYVPLLHEAYRLWEQLESQTGRELIHRVGLLLLGMPEGERIAGLRRTMAEHELDIEEISPADVPARFPGLASGMGMEALYEHDAGFLAVEQCVRAQIDQAVADGAVVKTCKQVLGWSAKDYGVTVETVDGRCDADTLIICGGPWAINLLNDFGLPVRVLRKVQLWYPASKPCYRMGAGFPVFGYEIPEGFFYGFPSLDGTSMKVAEHTGGQQVYDPMHVNRGLDEADHAAADRFVRNYLPGVIARPQRHSVCMYTMTPDEHFIVDRHPLHQRVFFGAGFSGHGFKFAPVIGTALAELATSGHTDLPIDFLRLKRFGRSG